MIERHLTHRKAMREAAPRTKIVRWYEAEALERQQISETIAQHGWAGKALDD